MKTLGLRLTGGGLRWLANAHPVPPAVSAQPLILGEQTETGRRRARRAAILTQPNAPSAGALENRTLRLEDYRMARRALYDVPLFIKALTSLSVMPLVVRIESA